MKILAIETSCDDTGVAILEVLKDGNFKVLANIVSSQTVLGKKYGGVFPAMAKREHQKNLVPVLIKALKEAKLLKPVLKTKTPNLKTILEREPELEKKLVPFFKKYAKPNAEGPDKRGIDLISVTNGPGLEPCLWVGVNFAKALSFVWNIPIVPVNHIESHILVNFLGNPDIKFPAICLVVSGGHTQLILVTRIGKYKILGETRDDAAGECFDKCAKILGFGYPGGPIISRLATKFVGLPMSPQLPRPMMNTKDYDFSFSGLKTAVLYADRKISKKTNQYKKQMAAEIQQAIIDVLIKKTIKAVKDYKVKTIILGGGVSANEELKKQFQQAKASALKGSTALTPLILVFPPTNLSTDNALMTATTGFYHKNKKGVKLYNIFAMFR